MLFMPFASVAEEALALDSAGASATELDEAALELAGDVLGAAALELADDALDAEEPFELVALVEVACAAAS